MPLIKSSSKKAFSHNVAEMIDHGHPKAQSLAAAYSNMRKAGHKMSSGGMCDKCSGPCKYDMGGEVAQDTPNLPGADSAQDSMRKAFGTPKKMADGGMIKGVHEARFEDEPGKSRSHYRLSAAKRAPIHKEESNEIAKDEHTRVLGEIMQMPKPKLQGLSSGGKVYSVGPIKDTRQPSNAALTAYDKGGPVGDEMEKDSDGDYDGAMNHELEEMACDELFTALKKGDKKEFMESLKALMMSMKD